ncbi:MAG: hypothetical protein M3O36_15080 [Myxococcota bacterium]|nr:hypothetical protein [Myxococcota bacterium]
MTPIHAPGDSGPMRVVFFASGGPGNLATAFACEDFEPSKIHVDLVVTDRPGIPAVALAEARGCQCIVNDYERSLRDQAGAGDRPLTAAERAAFSRTFHDDVLEQIEAVERKRGKFDLVVLAYRRIILGDMLERFRDRIVNQHPADLAERSSVAPKARRYTGISGLARSVREGARTTRTSTILVNEGVDSGEILCRGPQVAVEPTDFVLAEHELKQKIASDAPSLAFALHHIAHGRFGIDPSGRHDDGCRIVTFDGRPLPYGGVDLACNELEGPQLAVTASR